MNRHQILRGGEMDHAFDRGVVGCQPTFRAESDRMGWRYKSDIPIPFAGYLVIRVWAGWKAAGGFYALLNDGLHKGLVCREGAGNGAGHVKTAAGCAGR